MTKREVEENLNKLRELMSELGIDYVPSVDDLKSRGLYDFVKRMGGRKKVARRLGVAAYPVMRCANCGQIIRNPKGFHQKYCNKRSCKLAQKRKLQRRHQELKKKGLASHEVDQRHFVFPLDRPFTSATCQLIALSLVDGESMHEIARELGRDYDNMLEQCKQHKDTINKWIQYYKKEKGVK